MILNGKLKETKFEEERNIFNKIGTKFRRRKDIFYESTKFRKRHEGSFSLQISKLFVEITSSAEKESKNPISQRKKRKRKKGTILLANYKLVLPFRFFPNAFPLRVGPQTKTRFPAFPPRVLQRNETQNDVEQRNYSNAGGSRAVN